MDPTAPSAGTTPAWLNRLFASIDAKDADRFVQFLAGDAAFHFGNLPPAMGRDAIRALVGNFFAAIRSLRHELAEAWVLPGHAISHGTVTYTRHDGSELAVPFATVFTLDGELIRDYRIFSDASQLFS